VPKIAPKVKEALEERLTKYRRKPPYEGHPHAYKRVEATDLSARVSTLLVFGLGIHTVGELMYVRRLLNRVRGVGPKTRDEINSVIRSHQITRVK